MQKNHKRRVMMMNQSLQTDRKQYETQIFNLKEKIGKLLQAQNNINANLSKCAATRDGIIERVQSLEHDNTKLQNTNIQLKSRYDLMKVRFDEHVHNLEKDVSKFQNLLAKCDTNLQETSLVHDHILKEKEQVMKWRKEAQALSQQFKESEEANKKILMEREFANQQKFKLETNLKHILKEKEVLDNKLKDSNDTIREYKKMGSDLRTEMKRISNVYQTELRNKDSELLKHKNMSIEKERYLMQKINDVKNNETRMKKKLANQKDINEMTTNAYVDNLTNSAIQVNNLINAERLMMGRAENDNLKLSLNTGKSDIVNGI
jgi:chromosome segregation ATPase